MAAAAGKIGGDGPSSKKLVGFDAFVRSNPRSDRFEMLDFDHLEVWCADASSSARRFSAAFGLQMVAASDLSTGNHDYTSFCVRSNDVRFVFTAPYWTTAPLPPIAATRVEPFPRYNKDAAFEFIKQHGMAVRAVGVRVADAEAAYKQCVANGGAGVQEPVTLVDAAGTLKYSEVLYYGDVVLRFVEGRDGAYKGQFMPGYADQARDAVSYGLVRIDHVVSNVPVLTDVTEHINKMLGLHEFSEFVASDVGTVDSGLNSMVMANNFETVLLPVNEPTFGTRRKSQIQSFLEHHRGPGIQHIAISTPDIIATVRQMAEAAKTGGVEFMPAPGGTYYSKHVPEKMGTMVDAALIAECEKYGILIDRDEEGGLLQIFTKPLLDRPTLFVEIIQRIGCIQADGRQKPACGGFGKGNFGALFKSIEDYEKERDGEKDDAAPAVGGM